jgi:hypothetical protein
MNYRTTMLFKGEDFDNTDLRPAADRAEYWGAAAGGNV